MFRPQSISSTDARKYFTKLINKVSFSSKSFVIQTYRQPIVRLVNENYIRALEEVLGKKTVSQVMQIAGNDQLFEAEKIEQIKKVFQRRLSGQSTSRQGTPQQPRPQPQRKQDKNVVAKPASPPVSKPQQTKPQPKPQSPGQKQKPQPPQKSKNPNPQTSNPQPPTSSNRGVLLLSNGKSYE